MKLRTKFLISSVLVTFISISIISILHYYISTDSTKTIISSSSEQLLDQVGLNFEQKMNDISETTFTYYQKSNVCSLMESHPGSIMLAQATKQFLYRMINSNEYMNYAMMIGADGSENHWIRQDYSKDQVLNRFSLPDKEIQALKDKRGQVSWAPGSNKFFYAARAMYEPESYTYCGILVIGVDSQHFNDLIHLDQPNSVLAGNLMFLNDQNELMIYSDSTAKELYQAAIASKTSEFSHQDSKYIVTSKTTEHIGWRILNVTSFDRATSHLKALRYWILATFAFAFLLTFINAAVISKYITKKLYVLVNSMKTVSVGALHTVIRTDTKDEIGILTDKFNHMVGEIRELIENISQEKLRTQKAEYNRLQFEYKALQAQMDPHFLYNTLESIHSLARIKGEQEIGHMIYLLGKLLRESINRKEDFIPLKEELSFIVDYLTLQGITYESKLQVKYEIEEEVLASTVPPFILQPIVENAIVHGIEKKPGIGLIHIRCYRNSRDLVMEVEDNGVGMAEDTVNRLISTEQEEVDDHKGRSNVGVISVHKRLQILFGPSYGVTIQSELHQGTKITITQPLK